MTRDVPLRNAACSSAPCVCPWPPSGGFWTRPRGGGSARGPSSSPLEGRLQEQFSAARPHGIVFTPQGPARGTVVRKSRSGFQIPPNRKLSHLPRRVPALSWPPRPLATVRPPWSSLTRRELRWTLPSPRYTATTATRRSACPGRCGRTERHQGGRCFCDRRLLAFTQLPIMCEKLRQPTIKLEDFILSECEASLCEGLLDRPPGPWATPEPASGGSLWPPCLGSGDGSP